MDELGRTASRIIFPFGLLLGFNITFHGHLSPGGGFAGGAIIASSFALLFLTMDEKMKRELFIEKDIAVVKIVGGLLLLGLILAGFMVRQYFLRGQRLFDLWSGEYTPLLNFASSMMVAASLTLIMWRYIR